MLQHPPDKEVDDPVCEDGCLIDALCVPEDLDGEDRVQGTGLDMGCYEQ